MAGEAQRVINVIRQAIDQETGHQVKYIPGVISQPSSQSTGYRGVSLLLATSVGSSYAPATSAYIRSDEFLEDIIVPSGTYVASGDYAVIAVSETGRAWIDRVLPTSLFDKLVTDYNRGRIGVGQGNSPDYDYGLTGKVLTSRGTGAAGWEYVNHSAVTGVGADDHHAQQHAIDGADHTASGLTSGHVMKATGATTFAFGALQDADIPSTIARDSELHSQSHTLTGTDHTVSGLTTGHVLQATGATSFGFAGIAGYGCRAFRNSAQTTATTVAEAIEMTSETYDDGTMHDNSTNPSRIVLNRVGRWLVMGQIGYVANATGTRAAFLLLDGVEIARTRFGANTAQAHRVQVSNIVKVTGTTSYVEIQAEQNSGGNLDTASGSDETWLLAEWLGT